jgi:hypothetical protein
MKRGTGMGKVGSVTAKDARGTGMGKVGSMTRGTGMGKVGSVTAKDARGTGMGKVGSVMRGTGMGKVGSVTAKDARGTGMGKVGSVMRGTGIGNVGSLTAKAAGVNITNEMAASRAKRARASIESYLSFKFDHKKVTTMSDFDTIRLLTDDYFCEPLQILAPNLCWIFALIWPLYISLLILLSKSIQNCHSES